MEDSILTSTKKLLGLEEDNEDFDTDIITHINSAFVRLNTLGLGPALGFMIEDKTEVWDTYFAGQVITGANLNDVKTYVYISVKLRFDPPTLSYHLDALKEQKLELEVLLNMRREEATWIDPDLVDSI